MRDVFLKLMFNILRKFMTFVMIYHFLKQIRKVEELFCMIKRICHARKNLKQALNHELVLKIHRIIKFEQKAKQGGIK